MQVVCAILSPFSVDAGRCRSMLLLAELLALRSPNQGSPGRIACISSIASVLPRRDDKHIPQLHPASIPLRQSPGSPNAHSSAMPDRSKTRPRCPWREIVAGQRPNFIPSPVRRMGARSRCDSRPKLIVHETRCDATSETPARAGRTVLGVDHGDFARNRARHCSGSDERSATSCRLFSPSSRDCASEASSLSRSVGTDRCRSRDRPKSIWLFSQRGSLRASEIDVVGTGQGVRDMPEAALPQDRNEHVHRWRVAPIRVGAGRRT